MIKKIKSKLAVKVFIISALLMAFCCGITYFFILHFAPYIYSYTPSDVEWFADELAQELSMTDKGETAIYFSIANDDLGPTWLEVWSRTKGQHLLPGAVLSLFPTGTMRENAGHQPITQRRLSWYNPLLIRVKPRPSLFREKALFWKV